LSSKGELENRFCCCCLW